MDHSKLSRIRPAAQEVNVGESTLHSAIGRGELQVYTTACGLKLVSQAEIKRWAKQDRKPGRKPAKS